MASSKAVTKTTETFELDEVALSSVFGPNDELVRQLEEIFDDLRISARGNKIKLEGQQASV
ncbi:MAG: hypothetical protein RL719_1027, partial [Actinomycetota bacterium]